MIDLRLGDCLEIMRDMPAASVDAIIADIPYGTTACAWDTVIPFAPMWEQLKRLAKPRAAIVLFGSQPFTSKLILSNVEWFKYSLIWEKTRATTFASANSMPLRAHEDISVFANGRTTYNPQKVAGAKYKISSRAGGHIGGDYSITRSAFSGKENEGRFPRSIITVANPSLASGEHPTQKPVALMEYLIRTYTNEGDTILDFTCGSGSTLVAAVNTNRNACGIEKELKYFEIAQRRIAEAQAQMTMKFEAA